MTKKPGNNGGARRSPRASRDGEPAIHTSAALRDCKIGKFCEVKERVFMRSCSLGDYSYVERHSELIYTHTGRFCAIAADVRLNALNHPIDRVSQHKFTYRANEYFVGKKPDQGFREQRMEQGRVVVGHDVWIGHGAIVLPGVVIGTGAVIGAGAVVTHDVEPYAIMAGTPARFVRWRFEPDIAQRLLKLAWWDWSHDQLADAVDDMAQLSVVAFLDKYDGGIQI
jgi:phosphonate metabolism protein (transferase hexapeptide repeat family)